MNEADIKLKIITALSEKDKVSVKDIVGDRENFVEVYDVVMSMVENNQLTLISWNEKLLIEEIDRYVFYISYITEYDGG